MKNPFSLSDGNLKTLLNAYSTWCEGDEKEKGYIADQEQNTEELKTTLLSKEYLSRTSDDELAKKIFEYSRTLEGPAYIRLGMPRISGHLKDVKRNFQYLILSSDDPFKKASRILEGDYRIAVFAKAFWSPILQAQYPTILPNWNNKTERFLKAVGINLTTSKLMVEEKYRLLSDAFLYIQKLDPSQSFFSINHLMHYGTEVQEGISLIKKLVDPGDVKYWQIAPGEQARLWKDLLNQSIAAVGWNELDIDLKGKSKEEMIELYRTKYPDSKEGEVKFGINQLWNFMHIKPGDKIITNKGKSSLLAVGVVKSGYRFMPERQEYRHTINVDYYKVNNTGIPIPEKLKGKFGKTIISLEQDEFIALESLFDEIINPPYSLSQCAEETGFPVELLERWVRAIERKGQAIIYGPPGTGKTYIAERLAQHLIGDHDGFRDIVQFHPSYAYEDFIQGIRPQARQDGGLDYPLVHGRFFEFCQKAQSRQDLCVLIIDEINRANLARVLGELMYLLEYRDREIPLASGGSFRIPPNVRLIGTMNTADRSIALVDHALRRRFAFLALYPNFELLRWYHKETGFDVNGLVQTLRQLNTQIADPHYEIGVTFFLHKEIAGQIEDIWKMEIEPYLEEYFFDQREKVDDFRWEKIRDKIL